MAQGYVVTLGNGQLNGGDAITGGLTTFDPQASLGTGSWTFSGTRSDTGTTVTNASGPGTYNLATNGDLYFVPTGYTVTQLSGASATTAPAYDGTTYGSSAANVINEDGGDDLIYGGATASETGTGADTIDAGGGNDVVCGRGGGDFIDGGSGNDELIGDVAFDDDGGGDIDTASNGTAGSDTIVGGSGNDELYGDGASDVLDSGSGNDELRGGDGDDDLDGGSGSDLLIGMGGTADACDGGSGSDSTDGPPSTCEFITSIP